MKVNSEKILTAGGGVYPQRLPDGREGYEVKSGSSRPMRRGISLVEVMVSMLVALIGVFGVFTLIPFAVRQIEIAMNQEAAQTLGRNGIADFDASGLANNARWAAPDVNNISAADSFLFCDCPWLSPEIDLTPPTSQFNVHPNVPLGVPYFTGMDEPYANDNDFAYSTPGQPATLEVAMSDPTANLLPPETATIFYRIAKISDLSGTPTVATGGEDLSLTCELVDGGTIVATDGPRTVTDVWTEYSFRVAVSAVPDWSNVTLRFATTGPVVPLPGNERGCGISWARIGFNSIWCIDPWGWTEQGLVQGVNPLAPTVKQAFGAMPYTPLPNVAPLNWPTISRLSLFDQDTSTAYPDGSAYSKALARQKFSGHDDLMTRSPTDDFGGPTQVFFSPNGGRQYSGRFSWKMFVVSDCRSNGRFRVYTTVSLARNPDLVERVFQVSAGPYSRGGDFTLNELTTAPPTPGIRRGQWMMLIDGVNSPDEFVNDIAFYRVLESDFDAGVHTVTLQGSDLTPQAGPSAYAVLLPNVISVYERTINYESSSNWNTN